MTIIVRTISDKFGGTGGTSHDDFKDIVNNSKLGGSLNITQINIKSIDIRSGSAIDSLQFTYNIVTADGFTDYQGNKYGGDGGTAKTITLVNDERILEITGKHGKREDVSSEVVKFLEFQTSMKTLSFGESDELDTEFNLPVGVLFGSSGKYMDSIGAYDIEQVVGETKPIVTETVTVTTPPTITPSPSQNLCNPNSPLVMGLSTTTAILGLFSLTTAGILLWNKFRRKGKGIPTP